MFGTLVAVALTYFADQVGLFSGIRPEGLLETAQGLRSGLQRGATSAFGVGAETRTVGAALQYIPIGGSYLLFAPFPWDIVTGVAEEYHIVDIVYESPQREVVEPLEDG